MCFGYLSVLFSKRILTCLFRCSISSQVFWPPIPALPRRVGACRLFPPIGGIIPHPFCVYVFLMVTTSLSLGSVDFSSWSKYYPTCSRGALALAVIGRWPVACFHLVVPIVSSVDSLLFDAPTARWDL